MDPNELFERMVTSALEAAPKQSLKVSELRLAIKMRRGITTVVQEMSARGLVLLGKGELTMDTVVSLPCR